jgi:ABC-type nitrate/sulfonate/bicarbonate transport system ATPase subunit
MFQDSTLLPWKNVLENVLFPIRILRRPPGATIAPRPIEL